MVDHAHAWHPHVPAVREIYHATSEHAYPMHSHDGWAVMLVDAGAVSYGLHRDDHIATPGAVTLLPPGIPHDGQSAVTGRPYRKRVIYTDSDWLPEKAVGLAASRPTLSGTGALAAARRIHVALENPADGLAAEHWMLALRTSILGELGTSASVASDAPLARRLRALLDDRLVESFTIAEVADELGVHPSHLIRTFSREFGLAPHQYVISRRVDLARRMLVNGSRPAVAAVESGFHDQAHLSRHFRRVLGSTPGAFSAAQRALMLRSVDASDD